MIEQITLDRKEAEDLIGIFEGRIVDREVMGLPTSEVEQEAIQMLQDKLAGRIP